MGSDETQQKILNINGHGMEMAVQVQVQVGGRVGGHMWHANSRMSIMTSPSGRGEAMHCVRNLFPSPERLAPGWPSLFSELALIRGCRRSGILRKAEYVAVWKLSDSNGPSSSSEAAAYLLQLTKFEAAKYPICWPRSAAQWTLQAPGSIGGRGALSSH